LKITPSYIKSTNLEYNYEVKDIREFDCKVLLESDDIADNIIAILCNVKDIDKLFKKLQQKLYNIEEKKRVIHYILKVKKKVLKKENLKES